MANNPSTLKRQKQSEKRRQRNRSYKSSINTAIKKVFASREEKNPEAAKASYEAAVSRLDRAVTKGVLHRKTASRKISRLTRQYRQAES